MAKRFTDTEKWGKPFLRNLQAPYKLLWFYILDECDVAGIWQVDFDVAKIKIGEKIKQAEAIKFFGEKIIVIDGGEKWFIPSFINFQYGSLSENNRAHTKAIYQLKKFSLLNDNLEIKPLISPLQGAMEKEQEEVEDKEQEKVKEEGGNKILIMPFDSFIFKSAWDGWKTYKRVEKGFKFKSIESQQAALKKLSELSNNDEYTAIKIIEQSLANGWSGFFELNNGNNGTSKPKQGDGKILNAATKERLAAKFQSNSGNGDQRTNGST